MRLALPDPETLEQARQVEIVRRALYYGGVMVVAPALGANVLVGTLFAMTGRGGGWLSFLLLVGMPIAGLALLMTWRASHVADARQQLIERFDLSVQALWERILDRVSRVLGVALLVVLATMAVLTNMLLQQASWMWTTLIVFQIVRMPLRFVRAGLSYVSTGVLGAWILLSFVAVQQASSIGGWAVHATAIGCFLLSPALLVRVFLSERIARASLASHGRGLALLEVLLPWQRPFEIALERGDPAWVVQRLREVVPVRPTLEAPFLLLGRALEAQRHPGIVDYWVLGTRLMPTSAEVFAKLAEHVEDPALALAYARFAESNATRGLLSGDVDRYTALCERLARSSCSEPRPRGS